MQLRTTTPQRLHSSDKHEHMHAAYMYMLWIPDRYSVCQLQTLSRSIADIQYIYTTCEGTQIAYVAQGYIKQGQEESHKIASKFTYIRTDIYMYMYM